MNQREQSVTPSQLASLGRCEMKLINEWGYAGEIEKAHDEENEFKRLRGIELHKESEQVVERVFAEPVAEDKHTVQTSSSGLFAKITVVTVIIAAALLLAFAQMG